MTNPQSRYAVTLEDLERHVHVPRDEQTTVQPDPPPEDPISREDQDRNLLLGVTGAGRLRR